MAELIDGKKISQDLKDEVKAQVSELKAKGVEVALAVILVGNDPASTVYVGNKKKACEYTGIRSKHIDEDKVIRSISPDKDVDGFHPESVGRLSIGAKGFVSCTPAGVIELLKRSNTPLDGANAVVVGRSNIVGKPMSMLLLRENATVTVCHSHTKNLKEVCKNADVLVVAIGQPKFIDASYIKEGATVIDVGIHRVDDGSKKLCGDVDFESAEKVAGKITPVPGGVGPMTIAELMNNCLQSALMKL